MGLERDYGPEMQNTKHEKKAKTFKKHQKTKKKKTVLLMFLNFLNVVFHFRATITKPYI